MPARGGNVIDLKIDRILERLDAMRSMSPELEAAALISVEGLTIAASNSEELDSEQLAAMSAAMLALGDRIATELARGELEQVYIKGEKGYVLLMGVDERAVLTALAGAEAKLGLLFLEMRRAVAAIRALL